MLRPFRGRKGWKSLCKVVCESSFRNMQPEPITQATTYVYILYVYYYPALQCCFASSRVYSSLQRWCKLYNRVWFLVYYSERFGIENNEPFWLVARSSLCRVVAALSLCIVSCMGELLLEYVVWTHNQGVDRGIISHRIDRCYDIYVRHFSISMTTASCFVVSDLGQHWQFRSGPARPD